MVQIWEGAVLLLVTCLVPSAVFTGKNVKNTANICLVKAEGIQQHIPLQHQHPLSDGECKNTILTFICHLKDSFDLAQQRHGLTRISNLRTHQIGEPSFQLPNEGLARRSLKQLLSSAPRAPLQ
jgi:hypothetical protein